MLMCELIEIENDLDNLSDKVSSYGLVGDQGKVIIDKLISILINMCARDREYFLGEVINNFNIFLIDFYRNPKFYEE